MMISNFIMFWISFRIAQTIVDRVIIPVGFYIVDKCREFYYTLEAKQLLRESYN